MSVVPFREMLDLMIRTTLKIRQSVDLDDIRNAVALD